jgi:tRNA-dihydrouridine synthase B
MILPPRALMLAPMVELSHRPLRELIAGFGGCDRYYTEMCGAPAYLSDAPYDQWFLDTRPDPESTAIQFNSPDAERMTAAVAKLLADRRGQGLALGGIDLNFGCSAPLIEKAGGGVFWMKHPQAAAAMVASVRALIPGITLSVKMRLGYEESGEALLAFCGGLVDAGADYLILHPRLKDQKFKRLGKWDYVAYLAQELSVPVIGNGDIRDYAAYGRAVGRYGAAGAMIGREAVRRPWIFALLRGRERDPDYRMEAAVEDTGLRMLELIRAYLPPSFHLSRARRFFFYYCDNLSFSHHLRYAIQNAPDLPAIERLFKAYFDEVPEDRFRRQE